MTLEQFLFRHLIDDAAVGQLVGASGSPAVGRIYPNVADQGAALPYLTFQIVAGAPEYDLSGAGPGRARVQVTARAKDFDGAAALANAVRDVLKSLTVTDPSWGRVTSICVLSNIDLFDDAPRTFGRASDFSFTHP